MQDLYSRWKDEVISSIAGCEQSMRVIKEPLAGATFIGPYYFIMNDWQIRPFDAVHELIVSGTVVQDATSSETPFKVDDLTNNVQITRTVATEVQVVETPTSGLTAAESTRLFETATSTELDQTETDIITEVQALSITNNPTIYTADQINRVAGDDDGGTVANTQSIDGSYHATGENGDGLEVIATVNVSSLTENPNVIRIVGFYDGGGTGHYIDVQVYNYNSSEWENKAIMRNRFFDLNVDFLLPVNVAHQDPSNGQMQVRFLHNPATYVTSHVLQIDYIGFEKIATTSSMASDVASILTNTQALIADSEEIIEQSSTARKHLTNRDKIDKGANTLTRYDDDGTTPIATYDLKDDNGSPSSDRIFEKDPQ